MNIKTKAYAGQTKASYNAASTVTSVLVNESPVTFAIEFPGIVTFPATTAGQDIEIITQETVSQVGPKEIALGAQSVYFAETVATPDAGNRVNGAARAAGPSPSPFAWFQATAYSDKAGVLWLESSQDGATWHEASARVTVEALSADTASACVVAPFYRGVYQSTDAEDNTVFVLNSSYTKN